MSNSSINEIALKVPVPEEAIVRLKQVRIRFKKMKIIELKATVFHTRCHNGSEWFADA